MEESSWLLLLHQIPPKPPYFRAQVLRRLMQAGAVPLKNSAYLLPQSDETLEDFQWICEEILEQGGNAWLFRAETIAGMSNEEIQQAFQQQRASEYGFLLEEVRHLVKQADQQQGGGILQSAVSKLRRRIQQVRRIDFFDAPTYAQLEETMQELESRLTADDSAGTAGTPATAEGRTWVTRRGVKVDRISSAWLIHRFIDPQAQFRFVDAKNYTHHEGDLRFDMFEGEFTHRGDLCTFEVLLGWRNLDDPGLRAIAEIVHDIDLKEERYERPETAGVSRMIDGICARAASDETRLELGRGLFDTLYESFKSSK